MKCEHEYKLNNDGSQTCKFCERTLVFDPQTRKYIVVK